MLPVQPGAAAAASEGYSSAAIGLVMASCALAPRNLWGPRLTTRGTRYAYNSRSQETVVNPHNRVGITDTSSIT
jgi:hypothetical protein